MRRLLGGFGVWGVLVALSGCGSGMDEGKLERISDVRTISNNGNGTFLVICNDGEVVENATEADLLSESVCRADAPFYQHCLNPETTEIAKTVELLKLNVNETDCRRAHDKLMTLKAIFLESSDIKSIAPLEGLPAETILLRDNAVSDLTPLAGCYKLKHLDIRGNQVSNLTSLQGLPKLVKLELIGNPIELPEKRTVETCPADASAPAVRHYCSRPKPDLKPFLKLCRDRDHAGYVKSDFVRYVLGAVDTNDCDKAAVAIARRQELGLGGRHARMVATAESAAVVAGFTHLIKLSLAVDTAKMSLEFLGALMHLEDLTVNLNGGGELTLPALPSLHKLALITHWASDAPTLAKFEDLPEWPHLESLRIEGLAITTLAGIHRWPLLESLEVREARLEDASDVAKLPALTRLVIEKCGLEVLPHFPKPTLLHARLGSNKLRDLKGLAGQVRMHHLDASKNPLTDIKALSELKSLESLSLDKTGIRDVRPLKGLHVLRSLSLQYNRLWSLVALRDLRKLDYLELAGNPIAHVRFPRSERNCPTGDEVPSALRWACKRS